MSDEQVPEAEDVAAVVDAEPGGDGVAQAAADGEGGEEFVARHLERAGGEDEGAESGMGGGRMAGRATERMAWFSIQLQTRLKMRGGDVLFEEGHAAGLADLVAEVSAERGADGGEQDEEEPGWRAGRRAR